MLAAIIKILSKYAFYIKKIKKYSEFMRNDMKI